MAEDEGVTIEFLAKDKLSGDSFEEKLDSVLEKVKDNYVLVLEEGWTPEEKSSLIQASMEEIDDDFPGVEFLGLDSGNSRFDKAKELFYNRVLDKEYREGLTIVGNSRVMEKVKEERDTVSFLAKLENESGD
ncbi:hypothetical protein HRED_00743 [Candidatus Haloredivivus sp. G17]|jgi:hypothetical protein|nr:hypothetical protein HRED_00743 [Candidatus Haloredivivus sp. G17]